MTNNTTRRFACALAISLTTISIAGLATARPHAQPESDAATQTHDDRPLTLREVIASTRFLDRQSVDPSLRLNDGQRAVIEVMLNEHREAVQAWKTEHAEELQEFGRATRDQRAKGERRRRAESGENRKATRRANRAERRDDRQPKRKRLDEASKAQLKAIKESKPAGEAQLATILDILTPEQLGAIERTIADRRADRAEKVRERKAMKRERQEAKATRREHREARRGERRPAIREGETLDDFQSRITERIKQLPPEQQEQALEKLHRFLDRHEQEVHESQAESI